MPQDEIVPRRELDEILARRAELFEAARDLDASAARLRALLGASPAISSAPYPLREWPDTRVILGSTKGKTWAQAFEHKADCHFWEYLLGRSGLERMFGPGELEKFRKQLADEHIELTEEAAFATLLDLARRAPQIFAERCHTIMSAIDRDFATNDSFGLGQKFIWSYVMGDMSSFSYGLNYYKRDQVWDLDAVFHELDGKAPPARRAGLVGALEAHGLEHRKQRGGIVETDYFRAKVHKNTNVHFTVLDPELLERFNALVADHHRLCERRSA